MNNDYELRHALVGVATVLGTKRYVGQHPTEAANEFADAALRAIKMSEDRVTARVIAALRNERDA